ncbi:FMN-linked oxidoreductase [Mollisia scopiformis]|uniref:FMN-linked oxidoreductase n=1 Tax=Mollisia scopiformis TaxID=149040 RepID=A0A194WYI0_MOLSC|nr:FMN-linked oxidoreductase [Mollisia scopiformis]KUJ13000.1 FMN-linked oxidoreductase [Mollisia scopiformis]
MGDHDCPTTQHKGEDMPNPTPARKVPYYTPRQAIPSGTAIIHPNINTTLPKLFQPITLRGLTLQNRIWASPMCEYSADDGHFTDWHLTHLGGIIQRGPGLIITEATAVTAKGRITPEDAGLWKDSQIEPLKRICDFAHSQGQHVAVQLAHAGRKASTVSPWIDRKAAATAEVGGWPDKVISASDIPYSKETCIPRPMTLADIDSFKKSFIEAVKRALKAGVDAVEVHAAHGYLLHSTLSAATNQLLTPYSGSLKNRMRLLLELTALVRANIPDSMPLLVRIPGSDWCEHLPTIPAWDISQCVALARALSAPELGVDFLDITSAGLMAEQKITSGPGYQAHFSKAVKESVEGTGVLTGVVGMIKKGKQAEEYLQEGVADVILAGRAFQRNTALVWDWAEELGVEVRLANQIGWGFGQRAKGGMVGEKPVTQ